MPQDEVARSPEANQERMVLPSHMHIQLQLPTTPKLKHSSHFPKDFLSAVSISDNKTEAEGQLAVKRQVKELYPGAHFPVGSFYARGGTFYYNLFTLYPGPWKCLLQADLHTAATLLWDKPPTLFAVPISRSI